jgi:hypothetical protein
MHRMSFEVKKESTAGSNDATWPSALLVAALIFLVWALEPALIRMWMR